MSGVMNKWMTALVAGLTLTAGACAQDMSKDDIQKLVKEHRNKKDAAPEVGSVAPNFKLKTVDGSREVDLASFKGKKPVVLVFGSYT